MLPLLSRYFQILFAGILLFLVGCSSTPRVILSPANGQPPLRVSFSRAYFAPSESGEDRVILLSDPIDDPTDTSSGGPVKLASSPPIWHVLLIQLHWRIASPAKADSLVAHNAVLHWYVYGKPAGTTIGVLHYIGTGSVVIEPDSSGASVTVKNTDLELQDQDGSLRDPFHRFEINTHFHAKTNPALLKLTLDDVDKAIAEASDAAASPGTQPTK